MPGKGVKGGGLCVGNRALMQDEGVDIAALEKGFVERSKNGFTVLFVVKGKKAIGLISIGDELKQNAIKTIETLQNMGKKVGILTGDNQLTAAAIAKRLGVEMVYSEILPAEKEAIVSQIQAQGETVAFVGDGVNDAPALTKADVGIAIGAGTEIASESSDIVLGRSDPYDIVSAIALSRSVVNNVKQNLSWAFLYNAILIPLAAGAFYAISVAPNWFTGSQPHLVLTPMIGSIAMSLSSVTVVLNALRLRRFKFKEKED